MPGICCSRNAVTLHHSSNLSGLRGLFGRKFRGLVRPERQTAEIDRQLVEISAELAALQAEDAFRRSMEVASAQGTPLLSLRTASRGAVSLAPASSSSPLLGCRMLVMLRDLVAHKGHANAALL